MTEGPHLAVCFGADMANLGKYPPEITGAFIPDPVGDLIKGACDHCARRYIQTQDGDMLHKTGCPFITDSS